MNTVILEVHSLADTLADAALAMKSGRAELVPPSINSPGFERGQLNRYQKFNGLPPTISIGRDWMSIYQCSPYGTQPHFRWFRAQRVN
jgi:hypothetical protein